MLIIMHTQPVLCNMEEEARRKLGKKKSSNTFTSPSQHCQLAKFSTTPLPLAFGLTETRGLFVHPADMPPWGGHWER